MSFWPQAAGFNSLAINWQRVSVAAKINQTEGALHIVLGGEAESSFLFKLRQFFLSFGRII